MMNVEEEKLWTGDAPTISMNEKERTIARNHIVEHNHRPGIYRFDPSAPTRISHLPFDSATLNKIVQTLVFLKRPLKKSYFCSMRI